MSITRQGLFPHACTLKEYYLFQARNKVKIYTYNVRQYVGVRNKNQI